MWLLTISLGPVQDFIAAARRTADLEAGSRLLARLAQVTAQEVQAAGGEPIFPSLDLGPESAATDASAPNKILALVRSGDPERIAQRAHEAARAELRHQWERCQRQIQIPTEMLDAELAARQVEEFLEFYAAWWPVDGDYAGARENVERLLAGRKAVRDFKPTLSRPGRPKSPLDPARDCVLQISTHGGVPEQCRQHPLWLKQRETLDALSLLKRVNGADRETPSTSLMAVRAILPAAREKASGALEALERIADAKGLGADFGDLFFPSRVDELIEEGHPLDRERIAQLRKTILDRVGFHSDQLAYYAILAADGDRMGAVVGDQKDVDRHRQLSAALAGYAREACQCVRSHDGHPIYAGGDDVLALLPANRALSCAHALATKFADRLAPFVVSESGQRGPRRGGTLSVGIAIVHAMDPLQVSVERARDRKSVV